MDKKPESLSDKEHPSISRERLKWAKEHHYCKSHDDFMAVLALAEWALDHQQRDPATIDGLIESHRRNSTPPSAEGLRYGDGPGSTHWDECWRSHHGCAIHKIESLHSATGEWQTVLRRLMKEAAAVMALAEPQIRDVCGHTNFACLQNAVNEAGALLDASGHRTTNE